MKYNTTSGVIFDIANVILLGLLSLGALLPILYIFAGSFASDTELITRPFFLIPNTVSLDAYRYIFATSVLPKSLLISVFVTVFGTAVNLFFTFTMAYSLSRKQLSGRTFFMNLVIFSMLFSGGLVPTFLIVKSLGLLDSYWALTLPTAISAFNLIVIKTFFQEIPTELEESARMDGCTDLGVLWRIILPLSKPVIATFALFYAVGHWNDFFNALLYLNDNSKWPFQVVLRQIIMLSQGTAGDAAMLDSTYVKPPDQSVKMAIIVVGTLPILMVYPFLQKHFAKGMLIGAIKG